jgi:hypothetical protein
VRIVAITPFGVGNAVKAMRAKAQETVFQHFSFFASLIIVRPNTPQSQF